MAGQPHRPSAGSIAVKKHLVPLFEGPHRDGRPLLFLDFDDVLCLGPYGAREVTSSNPPADLYERLWHPPAVAALLDVLVEHRPLVILTSSWLKRLDRGRVADLLQATGLRNVDASLHPNWRADADTGGNRLQAIESWLGLAYRGERILVLDDPRSGSSLRGSRLDAAGCVVLCATGTGLHHGHLPLIRMVLTERSAKGTLKTD
ncbi:HAD domain-containing protein [Variovorax sp. JS1663]|uniref:HAD domain-containing protein n=1 Tax=Variovorax sp. JS1663 TaxID=1851577 RepID=UPI003FD48F62